MKQLTGLDAMFLYWETDGAAMHTGLLSVYDPGTAPGGIVDFATVRAHVQRCLPISDVFRQKLAPVPFNLDHPYWIRDAQFDLDAHLHRVTLKEKSWRGYCKLIARLHERPLDRSRPLWEMFYIDGLEGVRDFPKGAFALMAKIHHAAIDGATGAELTAGLHDLAADTVRKPLRDNFHAEREPSTARLMLDAARNNLRTPARLAGPLRRMLPGMVRSLRRATQDQVQRRGPKTRFNGRVSARRIYDAREYALKDLSAIRKAVPGATVNDVILTLASGAIRNYLEAKRDLPAESLLVMAPISTRSDSEKTAAGGNQVSQMFLPLCTDIAEPLARLARIAQHTARAKQTVKAVGAREMTDLNQSAPATTMALSLRLITSANLLGKLRAFNTVVSNVPGPQVPVYLCGARMLSWSGLGPCSHGLAFGFPVLSYNGKVNFTFNGCAEAMPDVEFAADGLDRAFAELKAAASAAISTQQQRQD